MTNRDEPLAPDLPEPDIKSVNGYHIHHPWAQWGINETTVHVVKTGDVLVEYDDNPTYFDAAEARKLAAILNAAALTAEQHEKNNND